LHWIGPSHARPSLRPQTDGAAGTAPAVWLSNSANVTQHPTQPSTSPPTPPSSKTRVAPPCSTHLPPAEPSFSSSLVDGRPDQLRVAEPIGFPLRGPCQRETAELPPQPPPLSHSRVTTVRMLSLRIYIIDGIAPCSQVHRPTPRRRPADGVAGVMIACTPLAKHFHKSPLIRDADLLRSHYNRLVITKPVREHSRCRS